MSRDYLWPYFEQNFITKSFGKAMIFVTQKLSRHTGGGSGEGVPNVKGYKISQVILKVVTIRIEIRANTH